MEIRHGLGGKNNFEQRTEYKLHGFSQNTEIKHVAKFLLRRVSHLHGLFSHDTSHLNISLRKILFILIVEDIIWVL